MTRLPSSRFLVYLPDLALLGVTAIWGATFTLVKEALTGISPLAFLFLRFLLASMVVLPLVWGRLGPVSWGALRDGCLIGVFLFLGYAFQIGGLQFTTPSKSAFITALSVVMVPLLAVVLTRRPPRLPSWIGALAATGGLWLLIGLRPGVWNQGDLLTLGCAFSFALQILYLERYLERSGFLILWVTQLVTVAVLSGGATWMVESVRWTPSPVVISGILVTGILATALAFLVQAWAQQTVRATRAAIILSAEPLFAVLVEWVFRGVVLSGPQWAGGGLILAGILVAELGGARFQREEV